MTSVRVTPEKKYRYVRYYSPWHAVCHLAEAAFYENPDDKVPLKGTITGTSGNYTGDGTHDYVNVFDGSKETFLNFVMDYFLR